MGNHGYNGTDIIKRDKGVCGDRYFGATFHDTLMDMLSFCVQFVRDGLDRWGPGRPVACVDGCEVGSPGKPGHVMRNVHIREGWGWGLLDARTDAFCCSPSDDFHVFFFFSFRLCLDHVWRHVYGRARYGLRYGYHGNLFQLAGRRFCISTLTRGQHLILFIPLHFIIDGSIQVTTI